MAVRLWVGGLAPNVTDSELLHLFDRVCQIKHSVVYRDPQTGRSKGFGFVVTLSEREAERAIATVNGVSLHGSRVTVNFADDGGRRDPRKGRQAVPPPAPSEFHNNSPESAWREWWEKKK